MKPSLFLQVVSFLEEIKVASAVDPELPLSPP